MRKLYINMKIRVIVQADDGVDIGEVLDEMDYNLNSHTEGADVLDTEITDYEITDSK